MLKNFSCDSCESLFNVLARLTTGDFDRRRDQPLRQHVGDANGLGRILDRSDRSEGR